MKIKRVNLSAALRLKPINLGLILALVTAIAFPIQSVSAFVDPAQPPLPLKDGTYLYGETPQPNKMGQEYLVFTLHNGRVVGALFAPRSEFSCFSGDLQAHDLNITAIGLDNELMPLNVSLSQLHRVKISAQERKTLAQCQQEIAARALPRFVGPSQAKR